MFHSSRYELDMDFTPRRNRPIRQRRRTTSDPASIVSSSTKSSTSSDATILPGLGSPEKPDEDAVSTHRHSLDDAASEHAIKRVVLRHAVGLGKSHPYMNGPRGLAHRVARSEVEGIGGFWSRGVSARTGGGSISHLKPAEVEIISVPASTPVSQLGPSSTEKSGSRTFTPVKPPAIVNQNNTALSSSSTIPLRSQNTINNASSSKIKRVPRPLPIPPAPSSIIIPNCVSISPLGLDAFPPSSTAPLSTSMKEKNSLLHSHPSPKSPEPSLNFRARSASASSSILCGGSAFNSSLHLSSSPGTILDLNLAPANRVPVAFSSDRSRYPSSPQSSTTTTSPSSPSPLSSSPSPSSSPPSSSSSSPPFLPEITPITPLVPNRPLSFLNNHSAPPVPPLPPLPKSPAASAISVASRASNSSVSPSLSSNSPSTGTSTTVDNSSKPNSNWSAINIALDASAPLTPLTPAFRSQSQPRLNGAQKQGILTDLKKPQPTRASSEDVLTQGRDASSPLLSIRPRGARGARGTRKLPVEPKTARLASASVSAFVSAYAKANSSPVLDISAKNSIPGPFSKDILDEDSDLYVSEREGKAVQVMDIRPRDELRLEVNQRDIKLRGGKDSDREDGLYMRDKDKDKKRFPLFQKRTQNSPSRPANGSKKLLESSTSSEAIPISLPQLPPVPNLPPIYMAHSTFTPEELARLSAMTPKERRKSLRKRRTGLARIVVELAAGKQVASVLDAEALNGLAISGEECEQSGLAGKEAVEVAAEISEILARLRKMKAS